MASTIERTTRDYSSALRGKSLLALALFGAGAALAAVLGGLATSSSVDTWYRDLQKPPFNPPSSVFGPVWTVLYVMMSVAGWLVWRRGGERPEVQRATILYGVQVGLNLLWSVLFFGLRAPGLALIEIAGLWAAIVAWLWSSSRVDGRVRWLILPYLAWVSFAALLNASIWWLNR